MGVAGYVFSLTSSLVCTLLRYYTWRYRFITLPHHYIRFDNMIGLDIIFNNNRKYVAKLNFLAVNE